MSTFRLIDVSQKWLLGDMKYTKSNEIMNRVLKRVLNKFADSRAGISPKYVSS